VGRPDRVIGRTSELEALNAFVEGAADEPIGLLLEGEAGAGKTTLWLEGVAVARERGRRVLSTRPAEAEARLGLTGIADLLDGVIDQVLPSLPGPQADALRVALLLERPSGGVADDRAVSTAVLSAVRLLAVEGPLIVAIDDIQWLDAASAGVLAFVWRRLQKEPLGMLATRRTGQTASVSLPENDPRIRRLPVTGLSLGAVHRLLESRLGLALPRPALRRVHEVAEGNPFYALELGRALQRQNSSMAPGQPLPVPDLLSEIPRERIELLPAATRNALALVAALSQPTVELVARAVAAPALAPAFESHVLLLDGKRVRFSHPLLASAAYDGLDPLSRRELHRRLAGLVEGEERAHHLALSADGPDRAIAAALEQASLQAAARGASAAAAELSEHARALTPPDDTNDSHRRSVAAANHRFVAGETGRARELLERSLITARAGLQRAETLLALGRLHLHAADQPMARDLAARAVAESGDHGLVRADAEQLLACTHLFMREELPAALRHVSAAAVLAAEVGDPTLLGSTAGMKAVLQVMLGQGEWEATLRLPDRDDTLPGKPVTSALGFHGAMIALWIDRENEAATVLRGYRDRAISHGDEGSLPLILAFLAVAEYLTGHWVQAAAVAQESHDIAVQAAQRPQQAFALGVRALVRASQGLEAEARADAAAVDALAGDRGMVVARIHATWALGILELSLDRPEAAARALAPLRRHLVAAGVREPGGIPFAADEVEALIRSQRLLDAERELGRLERDARAVGRGSALAAAARCRGLLAAARGDMAAAVEHLERALVQHRTPLERARTMLALGTAQRRLKRRALARSTLERGLRDFDGLGAALWADRARAELSRIGGRAPGPDGLTPTESRVAALASEGHSNKEIAATLFVTPKTVETQLSRIYGKLGVHSRTALAHRLSNL
jgi:DNA-binding CsgD family transcriptional regulator